MHREITHTDEIFHEEHPYSLYAFTFLIGALIFLDVWPQAVAWFGWTSTLPSWPTEIYGLRFALIAAVIGGARVLYTSLSSLFEGRLGADLALAIATIAAIIIREPLVAAEVVFIGLVGECLEGFTFSRTQRAIRKIVEVTPRRCWLVKDGQEVRVRTSELKVGDIVRVKPGAKVPVDGIVLEGRSAVDMSALTGESIPIDKGPGDEVLAGSINQFGALTIRAERVAEQTVVGRVIELTARALKSKGAIERTADRMARYFLPLVLSLAALTFLGAMAYHWLGWFRPTDLERLTWGQAIRLSVYPTLAVLVVACPCPLILATPAAIIAALGRLAGTGVLLKGGHALERLAHVAAFAFDKTGTLTEGKLEVADIAPVEAGADPGEVLRAAATAEQQSEHVIAAALLEAARSQSLELGEIREFQAHPGAGVTATTSLGRIVVGNRRLLEEQGMHLPAAVETQLRAFDERGQTALLVVRGEALLGIIGVRDRLRDEAPHVVRELRELGIAEICLLTGDREAVARTIAKEVGIDDVRAELLPQQKAERIAELRERLAKRRQPASGLDRIFGDQKPGVAMVGDGINDAPALASADVGLAIGGTGTDIAAEAGDVVLMGDPLRPLPMLLQLSRQTLKIIRQNIVVFAFGVNIFGVLLTAWLWPLFVPPEWLQSSPIAAVIYHQIGSIAVLVNSMRLLWFGRAEKSPTWERLERTARNIDQWMARYLNIGEAIHWAEHHWKLVSTIVLLLVITAYGLSGWTTVNADERAIVTRFGQPVADLGPGWYWRWPWPIETAHRIKPERIRMVEVGFRADRRAALRQAMSWISEHATEGMQRIPEEAVMMTGDGDLVDIQAVIRYRVSDIKTYLLEVEDPDRVIRGAAESLLRELTAQMTFSSLLSMDRASFQNKVLVELRHRLNRYGEHGVGVHVTSFTLQDLHPPPEVVQAYYEVTKAKEQYDQLINLAEADAIRIVKEAEAEQIRIERRAETEAISRVADAEAIRDVYLHMHKVREAQPGLTDFRLYWEALGKALEGRSLMLIDAAEVNGRRHLLMFDPETFRVPVPIFRPSYEPPERRPLDAGK